MLLGYCLSAVDLYIKNKNNQFDPYRLLAFDHPTKTFLIIFFFG